MSQKIIFFVIFSLILCGRSGFPQKSIAEEKRAWEAQLDSLFNLKQTPERDSVLSFALVRSAVRILPLNDSTYKLKTERYEKFLKISTFEQSEAYYNLMRGNLTNRMGYYNVAMDFLNSALKDFQKFGNQKMLSSCYNELATIVSLTLLNKPERDKDLRTGFYEFTREQFANNVAMQDSFVVSNYYLNIALKSLVERNYAVAKDYYRKSWQAVSHDQEKYWYNYHNGRWAEGLCLIHMGQKTTGFKLINESIRESEKKTTMDGTNLRVIIGYLLGEYYIENGQYNLALQETLIGVEQNKVLKFAFIEHFLNKNFYRIYKAKSDYKKALDYYEKITVFNEKLESAETKGQYMIWANEQANIKKDNRIKALEVDNLTQITERQNMLRNALIIGLILAGLLTIYILRSNRQLKEVNASLIQKNKEIETALFKGQHIERKRVASELHDTLATKVSALKWRLEAIEDNFSGENRKYVNTTIQSLDELYTDIRFISHNLLPEELERKGLKIALATLVEKLNRLNKTNFNLVFDGLDNSLEQAIQYEFYNIVLELCNNILKHAEATSAYISISEINERLFLTVTDNGVGINAHKKAKGIGQANIRNRIESLGGEIEVSSDETGTKIVVTV